VAGVIAVSVAILFGYLTRAGTSTRWDLGGFFCAAVLAGATIFASLGHAGPASGGHVREATPTTAKASNPTTSSSTFASNAARADSARTPPSTIANKLHSTEIRGGTARAEKPLPRAEASARAKDSAAAARIAAAAPTTDEGKLYQQSCNAGDAAACSQLDDERVHQLYRQALAIRENEQQRQWVADAARYISIILELKRARDGYLAAGLSDADCAEPPPSASQEALRFCLRYYHASADLTLVEATRSTDVQLGDLPTKLHAATDVSAPSPSVSTGGKPNWEPLPNPH